MPDIAPDYSSPLLIASAVKDQIHAQMRLARYTYVSPLAYVPDDDIYGAVRRALDDCANEYGFRRVSRESGRAHVTCYVDGSDREIATLYVPTGEG